MEGILVHLTSDAVAAKLADDAKAPRHRRLFYGRPDVTQPRTGLRGANAGAQRSASRVDQALVRAVHGPDGHGHGRVGVVAIKLGGDIKRDGFAVSPRPGARDA